MTMKELQDILGETIKGVRDGTVAIEQAMAISSLSKQSIQAADVTLRADKLVGNGGKRIDAMIGSYDERS